MKVILASKNQHKLTELSAILSGLGFEIALESEYGLDIDVDETGTTFEGKFPSQGRGRHEGQRPARPGRRFRPHGR